MNDNHYPQGVETMIDWNSFREANQRDEDRKLGMSDVTPWRYRLAGYALPYAIPIGLSPFIGAIPAGIVGGAALSAAEINKDLFSRELYRNDVRGDIAKNYADEYLNNYDPTR